MGIRVTAESLVRQMHLAGQEDDLALPYHQAILNGELPLSIGGGIGQARTYMYLLRTAHLGEVTVSVWPEELKKICSERNIQVLE
jgi:aspartate--ammonia ligase